MKKIKLDKRLRAAAEFVEAGDRVADVGTDHGYIPVWLRQNGISPFVIASDINSLPLKSARENAAAYETDGISFRQCDGLKGMEQSEADTVIIAGMGGENICSIIAASGWDWTGKKLILQPMTRQAQLVEWLYDNGFAVTGESFAYDEKNSYRILKAEKKAEKKPRPAFIRCGFTYGRYGKEEKEKLVRALEGLRRSKDPDEEKAAEYAMILEDIEDAYGT
ncbi:MAG: class I SAM-dependent methyltransferase [Oscillospiraceae bacterium]|nr:class I SAM-dependent methyltransferase [Oscillospiraceae bacterium]